MVITEWWEIGEQGPDSRRQAGSPRTLRLVQIIRNKIKFRTTLALCLKRGEKPDKETTKNEDE